ncbi:hypothetical protein L3X38_023478 [Prunus dulcis]|nr:hypothetical protein L3X38_023478 [Prunus dulcis]
MKRALRCSLHFVEMFSITVLATRFCQIRLLVAVMIFNDGEILPFNLVILMCCPSFKSDSEASNKTVASNKRAGRVVAFAFSTNCRYMGFNFKEMGGYKNCKGIDDREGRDKGARKKLD